jgi:hypothetical protein
VARLEKFQSRAESFLSGLLDSFNVHSSMKTKTDVAGDKSDDSSCDSASSASQTVTADEEHSQQAAVSPSGRRLLGAQGGKRKRKVYSSSQCEFREDANVTGLATMARRKLSFRARMVLATWFDAHVESPYPSHEETTALCKRTGLNSKKIAHWFSNRRKRDMNWRAKYLRRGRGRRPNKVGSLSNKKLASTHNLTILSCAQAVRNKRRRRWRTSAAASTYAVIENIRG